VGSWLPTAVRREEREEAAAEGEEGYLYHPGQNPGAAWPSDPDPAGVDGPDRDASTCPGLTYFVPCPDVCAFG
jgi:hypothetical protein